MRLTVVSIRHHWRAGLLVALGLGGLLALLARPLDAAIVRDVPLGVTAQPSDDPRWNSTVQWQERNGGGTIIGSQYFISARHLGPAIGNTVSLTTVTGGTPETTTYTTSAVTDIAGTDLAVWQISGTFPSSSIVPLYDGAAGTEAGQDISMLGYGYHIQGPAVVTGATQNGWEWGGTYGFNGQKNFGTNSVAGVTNDGPAGAPTLVSILSPADVGEAMVTLGDSGGGVFINVGGVEKLAGVHYAVMQFYSAPNAGSALNAAIYDPTGLYLQTNTGFELATDLGVVGQYGYASELAPYVSQIQQIIGVPEPASFVLFGFATFGLVLVARRTQKGRNS